MNKKLIIGFLLVATIVPGALAANQEFLMSKGEEFSYVKLEEEYDLNERINIPGGFVDVGGISYSAKQILTYPSGKRTYDRNVLLNEAGNYSLEYYFDKDNKHYSEKQNFRVVSPIFSIGSFSAAYYGTPEEAGTSGMIVELAQKEEIEFNQTLDITKISGTETFIESYIAPYARNVADFGILLFTFFNPLNPEEYIRFRLSTSPSEYRYPALADLSVQGNGTDLIGDNDGKQDIIHRNDGDGTKVRVSFKGRTEKYISTDKEHTSVECLTAPYDTTKLRVEFDYANKTVHTYEPWFSDDGTISSIDGSGKKLCCDLDDPIYVGSKPWTGFSNKYVKLKVSADRYTGNKARFVISKINGLELDSTVIEDVEAPNIEIYTPYDDMPVGKVDAHYPIPDAIAIDDIDGEVNISTKVWRNYNTPTASNLENRGGYFIPDSEGEYVIEYSATDSKGNKKIETISIIVKETVDPIVIKINESEIITSAYIGTHLTLPSVTYSGGSGDLSLSLSASLGDDVQLIGEDRLFIPEKIGEWTISYVVTDFLDVSEILSYKIDIINSPIPILEQEFFGDEFIISYCDYMIPSPKIIQYVNNVKVDVDFDVKVTLNEQTTTYHKGDSVYLGNIENGTKICFEYYCGTDLITSYQATIINPFVLNEWEARQVRIQNYFISENANIVFDEPSQSTPEYEIGAKLVSTGSNVSSVKYANYILGEEFNFNFTTFKNNSKYDSIDLVIYDSINRNNSITLQITEENGGFYASILGVKELIGSVSNGTYDEFKLNYSNGVFNIGNAILVPTLNDKNIVFNGFESNKIALEFKANGLISESFIIINYLGNQEIKSTSVNDYIQPQLFVFEDKTGTYDLGDVVTTSKAVAQDTLSQNSELKVSVRNSENEEYVKDINGKVIYELPANESYDFVLDHLATYIITYTASEVYQGQKYWQRKNIAEVSYMVSCIDKETPTIKFTSFMPETCKVGDIVALPKFTVSDNSGEEGLIIKRYMVVGSGVIKNIDKDANSYKFVEKGVYEYRIVARDSSGNFGIASMYITVK